MISVVIPVYNAANYIEKTLQSVISQKALDKDTELEIILVDDGSSDDSAKVIGEFLEKHPECQIRLLSNNREKGAAGARNTGVMASKGRYLCFLDSDDLWEDNKLSRQISFMREKGCAFSFTGYVFCDENGENPSKEVHVPLEITYREALTRTTIFTSTVMFDTETISRERLLMPTIASEDTALWWRLLREGKVAYGIDEILVRYRRVGVTLSSNKVNAVKRIWGLYRKAEGFGIIKSTRLFFEWALRTVARRGLR